MRRSASAPKNSVAVALRKKRWLTRVGGRSSPSPPPTPDGHREEEELTADAEAASTSAGDRATGVKLEPTLKVFGQFGGTVRNGPARGRCRSNSSSGRCVQP